MHDHLDPTAHQHLTSFALDRLLAHETLGTAPLYAHLQACAHCQERYAARATEQRAHLRDDLVHARVDALVAAIDRQRAPRRWHQRLGRWPCMLAVAGFLLGLWPSLHHRKHPCTHAASPARPVAPVRPDATEPSPTTAPPGRTSGS